MATSFSTEATLQVDGLTVRYGDTTAVDAVSMSARRGEILGLLGPNGAGKTSVIRALTTIVPAAAGSAVLAGHQLADASAVRSSIGVLPESNGYPGGRNGIAYLRYHAQLFGMSACASRDAAHSDSSVRWASVRTATASRRTPRHAPATRACTGADQRARHRLP